ncbi:MAG: ferredoxin [Candidatus Nanoarchaeia archaeon]
MTDEKKYKLDQDHPNCIGCGACVAVAPDYWEMNEDGKASILKGKTREDKWEEREITEKDLQHNKEAAESCPVNVIHLTDLENNEKII